MFHIVSCGYQCNPLRCIESVTGQIRPDWKHYLRMDTEYWIETDNVANKIDKGNLPEKKMGALWNYTQMINAIALHADPEDIIVMVDADDWLSMAASLSFVVEAYRRPETLLSYGSYGTLSGKPARFNGAYRPSDSVRTAHWKASHLRTFKVKLWKMINQRYFVGRDGKWLQTCYDLAIMMPMMEIAGIDRCVHVPTVLYTYNDEAPNNDHKVNREQQKRDERYIRGLPVQKRVEKI